MKKVTLILISIVILAGSAAAQDAAPILRLSDQAEGYASSYSQMRQIITTSSGQERTLVIKGWAVDNGEHQLAEYLAPADIRGQKILMRDEGDNIWMLNPETKRTRKLGSHMKKKKVMGSDFTYEDQSGGKNSKKFKGRVTGNEEMGGSACHVLELIPTPDGPSYEKVVAWVGKDDHITRRVDFYQNGKPFKRLISEDIRSVGNKQVPHKITMLNLEDGTQTVNIIDEISFDVDIPASTFDARRLAR